MQACLTKSRLIETKNELSRQHFYTFRKVLDDYNKPKSKKLKCGWFTKELAYTLQKFYRDYKEGKSPSIIIQTPPQHGKSSTLVDFIVWVLSKEIIKVVFASYSDTLGKRANNESQSIFGSVGYKKAFPNTTLEGSRTQQQFKLSNGSTFVNTTIGGAITGMAMDIGIIDDPVKGREEANSENEREKTWNWYTDNFSTRFSEFGGMIMVMTRWHVDDLAGRILEQDKSVVSIKYKAVATENEVHRKEGEALIPNYKSKSFLDYQKKMMPASSWESLYQQSPYVRGGNYFKTEWWQYYTELPTLSQLTIYADTAQKTKECNDYSVFQLWGKSHNNKIYLIDQVRGKWEAPELLVQAKAFYNKHKNLYEQKVIRAMKIEDKSSGTGLIQTLKKEGIPVIPIPRATDKMTRANDAIPSIESGLVYLPKNAPFLSDYLAEHEAFPNGKNDDQVDVTIDAITDNLSPSTIDWSKII